jgi:hypothetical protein
VQRFGTREETRTSESKTSLNPQGVCGSDESPT